MGYHILVVLYSFHSLAVSVKMSVLLYAPGWLVILLLTHGVYSTMSLLFMYCALPQVCQQTYIHTIYHEGFKAKKFRGKLYTWIFAKKLSRNPSYFLLNPYLKAPSWNFHIKKVQELAKSTKTTKLFCLETFIIYGMLCNIIFMSRCCWPFHFYSPTRLAIC